MLRYVVILLLLTTAHSHAQVVNSLSKDKTSFYGYALDTLVSIIKEHKPLTKVYVTGEACALDAMPDVFRGIALQKVPDIEKLKRMDETEVLIRISCISVIRYQVKLVAAVLGQDGKRRTLLGDGAYVFTFHYNAEMEEYYLKKLEQGLVL